MVDGDGVARAEAGPAPLARAEHRAGMRWRQRGRRFCRRYGYDLAVEQCPDEARELVSTRGHRHVAMLAALDQPSVQVVLPSHRAVGQRHQVGRLIRSACSQGRPDMHRLAGVWRGLRQRRPQASIAGSREAAASHYTARGLARREPQIASQLLVIEPRRDRTCRSTGADGGVTRSLRAQARPGSRSGQASGAWNQAHHA